MDDDYLDIESLLGDSSDDYDSNYNLYRRPWLIHNNVIYMGQPGTLHDELAAKHKIPMGEGIANDEGHVYNGQVKSPNADLIPMVQSFYNKHYKGDDLNNGIIKLANTILDTYIEKAKSDILKEPIKPIQNVAAKITGSKWAYLNGGIRQGEFYPDLIWQLGKAQGLDDADKISNIVAIGDWPITDHDLAIGTWFHGHPQIERSNVDRNTVAQALRELDNPA